MASKKILTLFILIFFTILSLGNVLADDNSTSKQHEEDDVTAPEDVFVSFMFIIFIIFMAMMVFTQIAPDTVEGIFRTIFRSSNDYDSSDYDNRWNKTNSDSFKKNKFKNFVGIEIEAINKNTRKNKMKEDNGFIIGYDASLSDGGREFSSEPMNGDNLINNIREYCKKLNNKKWFIDKTCGLHIHIETKRELELIKKLYIFYNKYEELFFNMMPKSRRENTYCKRIRDRKKLEDFYKAETLDDFMKLFYERNWYSKKARSHYFKKRYCWLNLHSIFYRGTLEIRNHSGTINSKKIINWIMIHLTIFNKLNKMSVEEVYNLKDNEKTFLRLFNKDLKNYIEKRWETFKTLNNEEDLK